MVQVFVSLGSNCERERHIRNGLEALDARFGILQLSSVYESADERCQGADYFNLVTCFETVLTLSDLRAVLRHIENESDRSREQPCKGVCALDIDILLYGDFHGVSEGMRLPRRDILQNAFVLKPLAELAGHKVHTETQKSYFDLWEMYCKNHVALRPIIFFWRGQALGAEGVL